MGVGLFQAAVATGSGEAGTDGERTEADARGDQTLQRGS